MFFSTANTLIINTSEEYSVIKVITEVIKKLPPGFQDSTTGSLNAKKISKPIAKLQLELSCMSFFLAFTAKEIMYTVYNKLNQKQDVLYYSRLI
jgi:hypothetical protein